MRVPMILLALVATPLVAASAQGNKCKDKDNRGMSQSADARAAAPGQKDKGCQVPPPPPVPVPPPPAPSGGEISGAAFADLDASFSRGADEAGQPGWVVSLSGPVSSSALTDEAGNYSFKDLPPGTYLVCEGPQLGWWQTIPSDGAVCSSGMLGYTRVITAENPGVKFIGNDFGNAPIF